MTDRDVAPELVEAGAWALHRAAGHADYKGGLCCRCPIEAAAVLQGALAIVPEFDEDTAVGVLKQQRDELAEALDDLHRYSVNDASGYAGSPCEEKVRRALRAAGRFAL